MHRSAPLHIALWLLAALALPAQAQDIIGEARRVHRVHRDALPQTTAYQIEADRRGWVWIATQSGIAYYNGRQWRKLDAFSEALPSSFDRGRRVVATADGRVWFAPQYGGLRVLDVRPGVAPRHWTWERVTMADGLPSDSVTTLYARRDGTLLAGTSRGLARRGDDGWDVLAPPPDAGGFTVRALTETRGGVLWVSAQQGLWRRMRSGAWVREVLPPALHGRPVAALHEDRAQRVWAVVDGGIARWEQGSWTVVVADERDRRSFTSILELHNGVMWFGTYGPRHGITVLRPDGTDLDLDLDNGLPSDDVLALTMHPDGTAWIGTRNGIGLYSGNEWAAITRTNGLTGEYVWHIAEARDGALWFGTDRGVSVYARGRWRTFTEPDGTPLSDVRFIYHASDGDTYVANKNRLLRYRDGVTRLVVEDEGLRFYGALEYDGEVLFTTATGLRVLRDGEIVPYSSHWYTNGVVKAAVVSASGALWLAINRQGIVRLAPDGGYAFYSLSHGLPAADVLGLYEDDLGLLWATTVRGVGVFDGYRWRTFTDTTAVRLPDPFTYSTLQDSDRRYYISTNRGVVRLTRSLGPPRVDSLRFTAEYFGPAEGLPSYEANFGAAHRDRQGRLWFGTVAGAALFDPDAEVYLHGIAPVVFERVDVEGLPDSTLLARRSGGPLRLSHEHRTLTFTYAHGAVSRPEGIRYRTQLVGYDAMTPWTDEGQRTFTNLPTGEYVFQVWGRAPDGTVSGPVGFPFAIAAAPWASWWAYLLYSFFGMLVMASIVRWQTMRIRRAHAHEAAMLQERLSRKAAEAQASHLRDENRRLAAEQFRDDMIRMLVHDLRSPLSIMQMVCREVAAMPSMPRETVNELMEHVVGTSQQGLRLVDLILDVSRLEAGQMPVHRAVVTVKEVAGDALATIWPLAEEKGVALEADIAPDLPPLHADRRLIDRVLANLLGNAIKFTPKGGSVRLAAHALPGAVEVRVTDTGIGIPIALRPRLFQKFAAGDEEGSGSGLGLAFCRLAVEAMGGTIGIGHTSSEGTTFVVTLPVEAPADDADDGPSLDPNLAEGDGDGADLRPEVRG